MPRSTRMYESGELQALKGKQILTAKTRPENLFGPIKKGRECGPFFRSSETLVQEAAQVIRAGRVS